MEATFAYAPRCEKLDHVPLETLEKMRESGATNIEIARKFGVSDSKISQVLPPKYSRLTNEDRQGIVRAWNQKKTKTEIAVMFGCSESTVLDTLRKNGVDVPIRKRQWTTSEIAKLERYHERGMTYGEIATELDRTIDSVRVAIKRYLRKPTERRLDGTPMPEKKEAPVQLKEWPMPEDGVTDEEAYSVLLASARNASVLTIEHTKTIKGQYGTYVLNCTTGRFDWKLNPGYLAACTLAGFREFVDEAAKVCQMLED